MFDQSCRENAKKPTKININFTVNFMRKHYPQFMSFDAKYKVAHKTFSKLVQLTMHFVAFFVDSIFLINFDQICRFVIQTQKSVYLQ